MDKFLIALTILGSMAFPGWATAMCADVVVNGVKSTSQNRQRVSRAQTPADRWIREKLSTAPQKGDPSLIGGRFGMVPPRPDFLESLKSEDQFSSLAVEKNIGGESLKITKVVFHVRPEEGSSKLYFINSDKFPFHYDFVTRVLRKLVSLQMFNENYEGDGEGREFNLATLVQSPRGVANEFLLEVDELDLLSGIHMQRLYGEVLKRLPDGATLLLHPLSGTQEVMAAEVHQLPFITTSELFKGREYFPLNPGTSMGYVNVALTEEEINNLNFSDVAIFDEAPLDIGLTAANGSKKYQTPLSHVNIKSKTRGTPNFAWSRALEFFKDIVGKAVRITVGNGEKPEVEILDPATADKEIAEFWENKRPRLDENPSFILDHEHKGQFIYFDSYFQKLPNLADMKRLIQIVGAKASNTALIGFINKRWEDIHKVKVPEVIGVPFDHHQDFLDTSHSADVYLKQEKVLDPDVEMDEEVLFTPSEELKKILSSGEAMTLNEVIHRRLEISGLLDPSVIHPMNQVAPVLREIRLLHMKVRINEDKSSILENFRQAIFENVNSPIHISKLIPRIRLRSSTNSEDLKGFTGAGLYNSVGVNLFKKIENPDGTKGGHDLNSPRSWKKVKADLEDAIRYDYAGVWNDRAFMEREWFSINGEKHFDIKVGLAVHRAFGKLNRDGGLGEVANFVAVTGNPLDEHYDPRNGVREFYFNSQHYDLAVTNPPYVDELEAYGEDPNKPYRTQSDLLRLLSIHWPEGDIRGFVDWTTKSLTKSSVRKGQPTLQEDQKVTKDLSKMEMRRFAAALEQIHIAFAQVYGEDVYDFMGDSEGKIYQECDDCERELWLKQFREFSRPGH